MSRHGESESVSSKIISLFMYAIIVLLVFTAIFGSWDKFVLKMIDVIPWGEFFFKTVAKLLGTGYTYASSGQIKTGVGVFFKDCMKLLIAATFMPIVKYFCGYGYGKHYEAKSISQKIREFFNDKIIIPVVISIISAWIVNRVAGSITSIGGIWAWILSIVSSIIALGISTWAFLALSSMGISWVIGYLCYKVIPGAVNAVLSYFILIFIIILCSSPEYIAAIGPIIIILIGIMCLINSVFGSKGEARETLKKNTNEDMWWL